MGSNHAEMLRQIAEEAERDNQYWRRFEVYRPYGEWSEALSTFELFSSIGVGGVRRKPRTVTIAGPGGTFEYPEPMREAPKLETKYFIASPASIPLYTPSTWTGEDWDRDWLHRGLCHTTSESAYKATRAWILASGGSLNDE